MKRCNSWIELLATLALEAEAQLPAGPSIWVLSPCSRNGLQGEEEEEEEDVPEESIRRKGLGPEP